MMTKQTLTQAVNQISLHGLGLPGIALRLRQEGYRALKEDDGLFTVYTAKSNGAATILVSPEKPLLAGFVAACQSQPDNSFLPRIFNFYSAKRQAHVAICEPLRHIRDFSGSLRNTMTGQADAYANFALGDEKHQSVHAYFSNSSGAPQLGNALLKIAALLQDDSLDSRVVYNPTPQSVFFRMENGLSYPVFVNPFRRAPSGADPEAEAKHIMDRCARLVPARPQGHDPKPF